MSSAAPPLRILHVIARLNLGGAAHQVLRLAAEQRRRGHEVLVVAGRVPAGEESMEHVAAELAVPLQPLPTLQRELDVRADAAAVRELRRLLRSWRPTVLHTHAAKAGATGRSAAVLAGRARPRALVHTFHGHVLRGYFGARRERAFRLVEQALARRTDVLVAVSEEVRDDLAELGVAPRKRFAVIPYGFSEDDVAAAAGARACVRRELGLGDETFVVGWIGRLTAIKRPLDLVSTLRALVDLGVDGALVAVGDGEERERVESLARELAVTDRLHLVGYRTNIGDWHAAFDALLLTSANEGTPVAAIEALLARKPVVATRVGGTPAVVSDGVTGFLADTGDTERLARRLAELARDPRLRERLGRAGADRVRERFGVERMVDETEAAYRRALAA